MTRLLASGLYRLVHGRLLWGTLGVLVVLLVFETGFLWYAMPERVLLSHTYACASGLVAGGFLSLFCSLFAVLLLGQDLDGGFAKTLVAGGCSRASIVAVRLVAVAIACVLLLAVGVAVLSAGFPLAGFAFQGADEPGQWWAFMGLSALSAFCYSALCLLVAQLARSKVAGVLAACIVSTGVLGVLAESVLGALSVEFPVFGDVLAWLPVDSLHLMASGAEALFSAAPVGGVAAPAHVALVFALWSAAACVATLLVAKRQDVA